MIVYGGNYNFYKETQELQISALQASLKEKEPRSAKKHRLKFFVRLERIYNFVGSYSLGD